MIITIQVHVKEATSQCSEMSAQEKYRSPAPIYYRGAHMAFLCFYSYALKTIQPLRETSVAVPESAPGAPSAECTRFSFLTPIHVTVPSCGSTFSERHDAPQATPLLLTNMPPRVLVLRGCSLRLQVAHRTRHLDRTGQLFDMDATISFTSFLFT